MTAQPFEGRAAFEQRLVDAFDWIAQQGCRTVHAWDASFADWPLSDARVLAALTAWARQGRELSLLAMQYDDVVRRHPRFVRWRRDFGHCVSARAVEPELQLNGAPEAVLLAAGANGTLSLRLFDRRSWRGEVSSDAGHHVRSLEWLDAVAQRSCESFAPTTLGL